MRERGELDGEQYAGALEELALLKPLDRERRPDEAIHFVLMAQGELNGTGGLVETTLGLREQRALSALVRDRTALWEEAGAGNAALLAVERQSGEVVAWVGSADYFDATAAGAIDEGLWCVDGTTVRAARCAAGGGKRGIRRSLATTR